MSLANTIKRNLNIRPHSHFSKTNKIPSTVLRPCRVEKPQKTLESRMDRRFRSPTNTAALLKQIPITLKDQLIEIFPVHVPQHRRIQLHASQGFNHLCPGSIRQEVLRIAPEASLPPNRPWQTGNPLERRPESRRIELNRRSEAGIVHDTRGLIVIEVIGLALVWRNLNLVGRKMRVVEINREQERVEKLISQALVDRERNRARGPVIFLLGVLMSHSEINFL